MSLGKKKERKVPAGGVEVKEKRKRETGLDFLFIWLHKVSEAREIWIFLAPHGIFRCDLQTLSCHVWDLVP